MRVGDWASAGAASTAISANAAAVEQVFNIE